MKFNELLNDKIDLKLYAKAPLFLEFYAAHKATTKPVVLVVKDASEFADRLKNINFFAQYYNLSVKTLAADDRTLLHATSTDPQIRMDRLASRFMLSVGELPDVLLLSAKELVELSLTAHDLQKHALMVIKGESLERDKFISALVMLGYSRVDHVAEKATFAIRGSVIDVFVVGEEHPIRLDLFGDEIETIKHFDENTQRSLAPIDSILIGPARELVIDDEVLARAKKNLFDLADSLNYPTNKLNEKISYLESKDTFYGMEKMIPAAYERLSSLLELLKSVFVKDQLPHIIFADKAQVVNEVIRVNQEAKDLYDKSLVREDFCFSPQKYYQNEEELKQALQDFSFTDVATFSSDEAKTFSCQDVSSIRAEILQASMVTSKKEDYHLLEPLANKLKDLRGRSIFTAIQVSSLEHEKELKKLLEPLGINTKRLSNYPSIDQIDNIFESNVHAHIIISKNPLAFGAVFEFLRFAIIAEDDIFGKRVKRHGSSGKAKGFKTSISDLEINDLVVHVDHGIGRFKGLVRLNLRGVDNDYILLTYAKEEKLYLPVHRINLIKPHGTPNSDKIHLDKLGGTTWVSKKKKVKAAVISMAQELLKLYAKREMVERAPFVEPSDHYVEFESSFEFETTRDQQKAIEDVLHDMVQKKPMDRLVCGDVGYGKTEVAMRASMLAVLSNRQVAILAPTTVLAQQHGINFHKRFLGTGANIAVLSRFQKASETKEVLEKVRQHKVDIVIGTHRLLSSDVEFSNLGLIVVDEEQRFGIKAKEHLKKMRSKVDVLTMSATPIPRTLQMSYFGIRDLSVIETPPVNRHAIETQVVQFDDAIIKEAVEREFSRDGQVFFVHNRVQSIEATAEYLQALLPQARIGIAHGQMGEKELEKVMLDFMEHRVNLLVCTTIIETGIDVATANTMFINDADDFGLSQLYQLRGRIGRSKERAFAYLLVKNTLDALTPIAKTRLEILNRFSELGAGFRIAQHDLELRGAGDLLGKSQHGHMAAVGYDLYADLMREAIEELKGQEHQEDIDPEVNLPISALIPENYCADLHERMSFYQRFALAQSAEKIDSIVLSMCDLYGDMPPEVMGLKISSLLKIELKKIKALKLEMAAIKDGVTTVSITLSPNASVDHEKVLKVLQGNSDIRLTQQNKVIQTLKAIDDSKDAILQLCHNAIINVQNFLLS